MIQIKTWTDRAGKTIPVNDLTDGHLTAIDKFLRKRIKYFRVMALHDAYKLCALTPPTADMASLAFALELDMAFCLAEAPEEEVLAAICPCWDALQEELKKRSLA